VDASSDHDDHGEEPSLQRVLDALESKGRPTVWYYVLIGLVAAAFAVGGAYGVLAHRLEDVPDKFLVQAMVREALKESPWSHDKIRVEQSLDDCQRRVAAIERLSDRVLGQHEQIIETLHMLQAEVLQVQRTPQKSRSAR
jgi:hypothetical protein